MGSRYICNNKIESPQAIPLKFESVIAIYLHVFGDGSILANCAAVYAVVYRPNITNKGLLVSKSRISKKDVTIPRLELASAYMSWNLVSNVLPELKTENKRSVVGRADCTVKYWLNQSESFKPFVANRISNVKQNDYIRWQYVPTKQHLADIGSIGSVISKCVVGKPSWLANSSKWPNKPVIQSSLES